MLKEYNSNLIFIIVGFNLVMWRGDFCLILYIKLIPRSSQSASLAVLPLRCQRFAALPRHASTYELYMIDLIHQVSVLNMVVNNLPKNQLRYDNLRFNLL